MRVDLTLRLRDALVALCLDWITIGEARGGSTVFIG
jgi:hypothetical protein